MGDDALPTIHALMPRVMESVGAIGKNQRNQQQGFSFRGIDAAMNAVQPALIEHGVHYAPEVLERWVEKYPTKTGTMMENVAVRVRYTFYGPAGDSFAVVTEGEAADAGDKATGKAQSIALKVALLHALCIPTEDMGDADSESHERGSRTTQHPPIAPSASAGGANGSADASSADLPLCRGCDKPLTPMALSQGREFHAKCEPA